MEDFQPGKRVLIAEDEPVTRTRLVALLRSWAFDPVPVSDGDEAWDTLKKECAPRVALLDWQMPGRSGLELCRLARNHIHHRPLHVILLTAVQIGLDSKVDGFQAGADDFLLKPFEPAELKARISVGFRLVELQAQLHRKVKELQTALDQVRQLQGLLPICMDCKKIRDEFDRWQQLESYIADHSQASFTHSLCPVCFRKRSLGLARKLRA